MFVSVTCIYTNGGHETKENDFSVTSSMTQLLRFCVIVDEYEQYIYTY